MMDNKLRLINGLIYLIGKHKLRIGLPEVNGFKSKYSYIFDPKFINTITLIMIFRAIINIYIKNDFISKYILCDFSYELDFGNEWKVFEITAFSFVIILQILIYYNYKNSYNSKIIDELNIEVFDTKLMNLFKYINIFIRILGLYFGSFFFIITLYNSFRLNIYLLFTIIMAMICMLSTTYWVYIYFWKLISFSLYCYRSKLLLNIENKYLFQFINENKNVEKILLLNCLKRLNEIYIKISEWNKIWNIYIAINLCYFSYSIGLLALQLYFSPLNTGTKILFYGIFITFITSMTLFMQTASTTNTESKHTYKLLSNYFAIKYTKTPKYLSTIQYKIKVSISKRLLSYFKFTNFSNITVNVIHRENV